MKDLGFHHLCWVCMVHTLNRAVLWPGLIHLGHQSQCGLGLWAAEQGLPCRGCTPRAGGAARLIKGPLLHAPAALWFQHAAKVLCSSPPSHALWRLWKLQLCHPTPSQALHNKNNTLHARTVLPEYLFPGCWGPEQGDAG